MSNRDDRREGNRRQSGNLTGDILVRHAETAEEAVLGTLLFDSTVEQYVAAATVVEPQDFYSHGKRAIFEVIGALYDENQPVTPTTVIERLRHMNLIEMVGGETEVSGLLMYADDADFLYNLERIKQTSRERMMAAAAERTIGELSAPEPDLSSIMSNLQNSLDFLGEENLKSSGVQRIGNVFDETIDMIEERGKSDGPTGLSTGFIDLDKKLSGLHPGQMVVVAARPAVGKSTLGMDFVRAASIANNVPSLFISLEMTRSEIMERVLSAEARVKLQNIRSGKMSEEDWGKIERNREKVVNAPIFIEDNPSMTMAEIRAAARRLKQAQPDLGLIVIDYLQLMSSGKRVESRQLEVSEFSRQIKVLAKELNVPVVAISQLNRGSEQRADKQPVVSDLRESGSIEQDADVIILLFREDHVDPDSPRVGEADFIVAKQRSGPTGTVKALFQGQYSKFVDPAHGIGA